MIGGGALFFCLKPTVSFLSDTNEDLVNFYQTLAHIPDQIIPRMMRMRPSRQTYYALRAATPRTPVTRATRFAYLNRLCWNGLYRVNRQGRFNVPIGDRLPKKLWDKADLSAASAALTKAHLRAQDFEDAATHVRAGDFVYFDPPYPRGSKDLLGFNRYSRNVFTIDDHKRLARVAETLMERGAYIMISISGSGPLAFHYPKSLKRRFIVGQALISCSGSSRRTVRDVVLRNFD